MRRVATGAAQPPVVAGGAARRRPSRPPRGRAPRRSPRRGLGRRRFGDGRLGAGDAVAGQEVVVIGVGLERERGAAREGGDQLVGRAGDLFLGLGHRHRLDLLGLGRAAGGALAGALDRGVGDERAQQADRADGVVVGRDDVVELVGVDVRVAGADDRDLELVRLGHADPLAVRVDDEDGAGQALHLAHAAERALELDHLLGQLGGFLLGHPLEVAVLPGVPRAARAAPIRFLMVTKLVSMPPSQRLLTYGWSARVASWATGSWACFLVPDEQDLVAAGDGLADELEGDVETLDGLGQVDDVDPVALREDERASSWGSSAGSGGRSGLRPRAAAASKRTARWRPPVGSFLRGPRRRGPAGLVALPAPSRSERSACVLHAVWRGRRICLVARGHAPDRAGV